MDAENGWQSQISALYPNFWQLVNVHVMYNQKEYNFDETQI